MSDEKFLEKYEELLNKDYCNCNEMNCIDNNSPRRILNIAKKQKEVLDDIKENLKNTDFEYLRLTNNHCLADYLERLLELLEEIE